MDQGELRRARCLIGNVSKRAPHPLEGSVLRIEDDHAVIAITIGDEDFIAVEKCVGGLMQVLRIGVSLARIPVTDLKQKLSSVRKFQKHVVGITWRQWR